MLINLAVISPRADLIRVPMFKQAEYSNRELIIKCNRSLYSATGHDVIARGESID